MHVAGSLDQAHVEELLEACAHAARPIVELHDLRSVDAEGIDTLMRIQQQGARLVELPEHLRVALQFLQREHRR